MRRLAAIAIAFLCAIPLSAGSSSHHHDEPQACPIGDRTVDSRSAVTLEGSVVCMHCTLGEEPKCRKIFVASDEVRYDLCPSSDIENLAEMSRHGERTIRVSGEIVRAGEASMLVVRSAEAVAD